VRVVGVGLNFADIFACLGLYEAAPKDREFTPGLEFSGEIIAAGAPSASPGKYEKKFKVGDRVMGVLRFGAYASVVNVRSEYITLIPAAWSFEQGAAFAVQALTAWYGLVELGSIKQGQTVLVHSAAGGVGLLAVDLLQKKGCTVVGTVSSAAKLRFLQERTGLSDNWIVRTSGSDFPLQLQAVLKRLGKKGFDVIFDSLAGEYFQAGFNLLLAGGRLVMFGAGSMMSNSDSPSWLSLGWKYWNRPQLDLLALMGQNRTVSGFNLIWLYNEIDRIVPMWSEAMQFDWKPPHVGHTYPFEEAPKALRFFQSGQSIGKVVLQVVAQPANINSK